MADHDGTPSALPAHVLAECQRILDREARRILDEQLAAETKAERTPTHPLD